MPGNTRSYFVYALLLASSACGRLGYERSPVTLADGGAADGTILELEDGGPSSSPDGGVDGGAGCGVVGATVGEVGPRAFATDESLPTIEACGDVWESGRLVGDLVSAPGDDCLVVRAAGVVIEGAGHLITAGGHAIVVTDHAGLVVRHVRSAQGVEIAQVGGDASGALVEDSELGWLGVYGPDDVVVRYNRLGGLVLWGFWNGNVAERALVEHNEIRGSAAPLVDVYSGDPPYGIACPVSTGHTFTDNEIVSDAADPSDHDEALYVRCVTDNVFRNVSIRSTAEATGIVLTGSSTRNRFERLTVRTDHPDGAAVVIYDAKGNELTDSVLTTRIGAPLSSSLGGGNVVSHVVLDGPAPLDIEAESDEVLDHVTILHRGIDAALLVRGDATSGRLTMRNSIVWSTSAEILELTDGAEPYDVDFDFDVYHSPGGAARFGNLSSFTAWQTTGSDASSLEADPELASLQPEGAWPLSGSPARVADERGGTAGAFACP